ncbi:MAG: type IV secretion system protein [Gallionella sp.]|nr:type IV secretion system protein [Gallionella sp.]
MKPASIILLALGVSLSSAAWAGDPVPGLMDQWKTITQVFGAEMVKQGANLLFALAGLQFTINGINYLRKGKEIQELVMHMVWTLVTVTFFYTCIIKSPTWFPYILDSWHALGAAGTHTGPLDPGAIISMGISVVETIRSTVAAKAGNSLVDLMSSFSVSLQVQFIEIFILLAFLVLAGQLALAMIKGYMWLCIGPVLLGFGGLTYTKDVAMNTLKSAISIGVTILTCYVVAGIAQASVSIFNQQISTFTIDNWLGLWNCVGVAFMLALAAWSVPKIANDFINGSISGGVGETMATAATAAAGAAALTAGVGGMMSQVASGAVESLGGIAQAAGAGMNSATDLGKSGLDAVGHAAKEVAGHGGSIVGGSVRNMLDTASSGVKEGMNKSFGGQVASSIDASRGGSISPANGTGSKSGSTSGSNPPGSDAPSGNANAAGERAPSSSGSSPSNSGGLGDANNASLSSGANGGSTASGVPDPLVQRLDNLTAAMENGNKSSTADKIRNLAGYVPNDQSTVGVSANLGHHGEE